jgi:hypothetical protein
MLYRIFYNKIKSKKEYCFILLTFFVHQFAIAQDIHFSQFYNSPLTANPANRCLYLIEQVVHLAIFK